MIISEMGNKWMQMAKNWPSLQHVSWRSFMDWWHDMVTLLFLPQDMKWCNVDIDGSPTSGDVECLFFSNLHHLVAASFLKLSSRRKTPVWWWDSRLDPEDWLDLVCDDHMVWWSLIYFDPCPPNAIHRMPFSRRVWTRAVWPCLSGKPFFPGEIGFSSQHDHLEMINFSNNNSNR